jgi:hypothetical protein
MSVLMLKIAKAIQLKCRHSNFPFAPTNKQAVDLATAVLEAMKEPTEEMLNAARDWSYKKYGKPVGNDGAIGCWKAMIEECLK